MKVYAAILSVTAVLVLGYALTKQEPQPETMVHYTRMGNEYHATGCGSLDGDRYGTVTISDAIKAGLTRCPRCNPG